MAISLAHIRCSPLLTAALDDSTERGGGTQFLTITTSRELRQEL
jgi:hypothetical protein